RELLASADSPGTETVPGRAGVGVGAWTVGTCEQLTERALPTGAQSRDVQGETQLLGVSVGEIEKCVGVGHAQLAGPGPGPHDPVAGLDVSLADDPHVETG